MYIDIQIYTHTHKYTHTCPGKKEDKIIGRPRIIASAIVPGPAFVIRQSAAPIYSSMFCTNFLATTLTFLGHFLLFISSYSLVLCPHITTTCDNA